MWSTYNLVALFLLIASPLTHTTYQLTGTVTYGPGFPLEGAHVYALDAARAETLAIGITDTTGSFTLTLPIGTAIEVPQFKEDPYRIITLYPQPVQGKTQVHVLYTAPFTERTPPALELFDVIGRQLSPEPPRTTGVYFLRLRFASGKYSPFYAFIQPIEGAPKIVLHRTTLSSPSTSTAKQNTASQQIWLHIEHPYFAPYEQMLSLGTDTTIRLDATLDPSTALLTPTANQPEHLLFVITAPPHIQAHYFGMRQADTLQLTYLLLQQEEQLHGIVFNETHHPIQWITDSVTVAVRRLNREPFDPSRTFLSMVYQSIEDTLTLDLSDQLLSEILTPFEELTNQTFPEARALVNAFPEWTSDSLASWSYRSGNEQAGYLAAATAFRTAQVARKLWEVADTLSSSGKVLYGEALAAAARQLIQIGAASLGHVINRELGPGNPNDPEAELPQLPVLLCRGAAKYGLCHYLFFRYLGSTAPCISFCKTSLRCFSDICQPKTLDMQRALALRESY